MNPHIMKKILIRFVAPTMFAIATPLSAVPIYVDFGTAAPSATLGGYSMTAFSDDTSAEGTSTLGLASPVSGNLQFSTGLTHFEVGGGWASWSHGYAGDAYHLDELQLGNMLTMTMPAETMAFSFYLEPAFFDLLNFSISVETFGGLSTGLIPATIAGSGGATGFGFYSDDLTDSIKSITIEGLDTFPDGFAVGEFAINSAPPSQGVPDGGASMLLLGVALSGLGAVRRFLPY